MTRIKYEDWKRQHIETLVGKIHAAADSFENPYFQEWTHRNRLTNHQITKILGLPAIDVWRYLAGEDRVPRVVEMACWAWENGWRNER